MSDNQTKILYIEDDEDTCELISFVFEKEGYKILACGQKECLKMIEDEEFSAVILDNYFGEISGIEICRRIRALSADIPIVFFSGEAREIEINKAIQAGATLYLVKPLDFEKLLPSVTKLISG